MIKFGTGGWRDIIGENFTFANVRLFAQGVAHFIKDQQKQEQGIVIGYDNRFMSEEFAMSAAEVLVGNGIPVLLTNKPVPTPLVTFVTKLKSTAAGMTFTASHNPAVYNGIKFVCEDGMPATVAITRDLEKRANAITDEQVLKVHYSDAVAKGFIQRVDYHNEFIDFIEQGLDMEKLRSAHLNVLYDPMFGTGVTSITTLLIDARCKLEVIHERRDPLFGGRSPAPSEDTLWRLISMMKEGDYDIGLATDGDADRLAIIDNRGEFVHPNEILSILYYYFLEYRGIKGNVVRNICTTHLLDRIAEDYGQTCIETPVGFKYIAEGLLESNAILGGESSGGTTIRGHLLEKDGILAAGLILEMMAQTGKSLREIRQELKDRFGEFHFVDSNLTYNPERKAALQDYLIEYKPSTLNGIHVVHIEKMDGVKYILEDGSWISCRFSGTEPLLRLMAESNDQSKAYKLIKVIKDEVDVKLAC
jgi:alpha-D-glucose phosphate-specific phosphoglucomutase